MGWLTLGFFVGMFFGVFVIGLARAAALETPRREGAGTTLRSHSRAIDEPATDEAELLHVVETQLERTRRRSSG